MDDRGVSVVHQFVPPLRDPDPAVRARAVGGLAYAGRFAAGEIVMTALESIRDDPDPWVRHRVAWILTSYREDMGKLGRSLGQDKPEALVGSLSILAAYRGRARQFLPQFESLTRHADPAVRAAARAAIEQIAPARPLSCSRRTAPSRDVLAGGRAG